MLSRCIIFLLVLAAIPGCTAIHEYHWSTEPSDEPRDIGDSLSAISVSPLLQVKPFSSSEISFRISSRVPLRIDSIGLFISDESEETPRPLQVGRIYLFAARGRGMQFESADRIVEFPPAYRSVGPGGNDFVALRLPIVRKASELPRCFRLTIDIHGKRAGSRFDLQRTLMLTRDTRIGATGMGPCG